MELEGIPETTEDIPPFKVVGDNLISHFSHEKHTLRLHKENVIHDECTRCEACIYLVGFEPIYSCEKCCFILHEKCANFPMKKKLVFGTTPYTLEGVSGVVDCKLCGLLSDGFKYSSQGKMDVDVHCGSVSEPFIHDFNPLYGGKRIRRLSMRWITRCQKPLHFVKIKDKCTACKRDVDEYMPNCNRCDIYLCLNCASLPKEIWHRSDEHPLKLYYGQMASGECWCHICERELDGKWFFMCYDCGETLHAHCVLGDFSRLKPERVIVAGGKQYKVVLNNRNTRPLCSQCHSRCKVSVILKDCGEIIVDTFVPGHLCRL